MTQTTKEEPVKVFRFSMPCGCSGGVKVLAASMNSGERYFPSFARKDFIPYACVHRGDGTLPGSVSSNNEVPTPEEVAASLRRGYSPGTGLEPEIEVAAPGLQFNEFYKRVWRPGLDVPDAWADGYINETTAFLSLQRDLLDLFRVIEPCPANVDAYGHAMRQLLILACTEAELLLKRVLTDNDYKPVPDTWTTNQYVDAIMPLRLDKWAARLVRYESYGEIRPFAGWKRATPGPTKTLAWYDAYNGAKHDRVAGFAGASLKRVLEAMAGVYILLTAQYGFGVQVAGDILGHRDEDRVFYICDMPKWSVSEHYILEPNGRMEKAPRRKAVDYPWRTAKQAVKKSRPLP